MRITGPPTGEYRFRCGFTGVMILQIKYKWFGMAAYSHHVADHLDWRDATESDLRHPNLRGLLQVVA